MQQYHEKFVYIKVAIIAAFNAFYLQLATGLLL